MSASRGRMAFTRESPTTPPDLYVVSLDGGGRAAASPRRLTDLAPRFPLAELVQADTLSWPSPDGRFTIHGLLLVPRRAPGGAAGRPEPTLLKIDGGPQMVRRAFAFPGWNGIRLSLAARGYAVLIPNTRGRDGYGPELEFAFREDGNRARGPLADALAGLDFLIASGVADPDRLGMLGHSYGGYLTAYAITRTDRFKAAVVYEGGPLSLMTTQFFGARPGAWQELMHRDLAGIHDPFDPAERMRLLEESPALNADRVRTPTLLLYGARAGADTQGRPFYHALLRFGVPAGLFIYDEGHGFGRPAAIADNLTRTGEWLDHWVRDSPP